MAETTIPTDTPPGLISAQEKRVQKRPEKRRLLRNTGFSLGQQIAAMALAVVLVPYMLWHLGPELYGLWLILQLFNILGLAYLAELGFQGALVRYLARFYFEGDRQTFRAVLGGGLALFIAIGFVMGSAAIAFAQWALPNAFPIPPEHLVSMQLALTIGGAGLIAAFPGLVLKAYFAARQDLAMTKLWELADRVLFAVGVFVILQVTTDLVVLIVLEQAIAVTLMAVFAVLAMRSADGWLTLRPRLSAGGHFKGLARLSASVFAANFAHQGFNRVPEVIVGAILGPITLTYYQIATRIPRVIKTLQGSLNAAVLPHISGLDVGGDGSSPRAEFALAALRLNYIIAVPMLVGTAVLAPALLGLWVGEEYRKLAPFLATFALFQGLLLAINVTAATLTEQHHFRFFVRAQIALLGFFLAALVMGLGAFGLAYLFAALAIVGAALFACAIFAFARVHSLGRAILLREVILGPILISALAGASVLAAPAWLLAENHWIGGSCALLVSAMLYAALLYGLVLHPEERARFAWLARSLKRSPSNARQTSPQAEEKR